MNSKQKYREFCQEEESIPIFSKAWWLDTVCGEGGWEVALIEENNRIIASLPYYPVKKKGFLRLEMPPLTQTLGPWLPQIEGKMAKKLARQKDLMTKLIDQLPEFDFFYQKFHYSITNWLPFFWNGFEQSSSYTYVIEDLEDMDANWDNLQGNLRREIKKAEKILTIKNDASLEDFLRINELTFQRQGINFSYSDDLVKRIYESCKKNNAGKIFSANDEQGRIHTVLFLIWDKNEAYYLMGGSDPDLRNSGSGSLCMWEAIKFSATQTKAFNFEGSMLESVEHFFRSFGSTQKPYFQITKCNSKLLKVIRDVKSWI